MSTHSFTKHFPLNKTQIPAIILHSTNSGNVSTLIFHGYLSTRMKTSSSYCLFNGTCRFYCLIFGGFFCFLLCVWEKTIYIFFWSPLVYAHAMKQSHNSFSFDNFVAAGLLDFFLDISHLLTYRWPCITISMQPDEFFLRA